ncbi:MAG: amino acid ABC transporter permease [Solirubrobacterales bacterium]|nr:amino acid ABC transporter permease [Solirubrobacterales bacterium]
MLDADQYDQLLSGLLVSLKVTGLVLLFGLPLGCLLAVLVASRSKPVSLGALAFVEIARGMPALVLLSLVYFGLPQQGITLTALAAAVLALGLNTGAYTSEIFRAALRAVPRGQREAAASLGLTRLSAFRTIVLPQALRIALPQLVGFSILVFQGTALCFAIALPELLSQAYQIGSTTFRYLTVLSIAAAMYAAIAIPVSQYAGWLERRMSARI